MTVATAFHQRFQLPIGSTRHLVKQKPRCVCVFVATVCIRPRSKSKSKKRGTPKHHQISLETICMVIRYNYEANGDCCCLVGLQSFRIPPHNYSERVFIEITPFSSSYRHIDLPVCTVIKHSQ